MTDIEHSNWEQINNSLEWRINESFKDFNLNENQKKRLLKCIERKIKGNEEAENIQVKERIVIKKFKKIIEKSIEPEEWIKIIEEELNELETTENNVNKINKDNDLEESKNQTQSEQIKAESEQTKAQSEQTKAQSEQTKAQSEQWKIEIENEWEIIKEHLKKLDENFSKINDNYKPTEEELTQKKDSIPEETKKRLAENNIPEEQYLRFSIAREKIYKSWNEDNSQETKAFLNSLKEFEDKLWITAKWIPLSASQEIFNDNPLLDNFKNNNTDIQKLNNISYFWKENIDPNNPESINKAIGKYKKVEKLYRNTENYPKDNSEDQYKFSEISEKINSETEQEITDEEKIFYINKLENANSWIREYSKMSAAQAPLTWILKYLDSYNEFNKDTLKNRFWKSDKEFIEASESENKINMSIDWIVDWNPISFYYNIENWKTNISCDDVLQIKKDKNEYKLYNWIWEKPKSDLKINMPSISDIVSKIENIPEEEYTNLLEWSNDIKDLQSKITSLITNKVNESFPSDSEIKTRIARFTEKNLTAQAFDSALLWDTELKKKLNNKLEEWTEINSIRRMMILVDNTTEKSTSSDLVELKQGFKNLEWLLWKSRKELNKIKDPVARESLIAIKNAKENKDYNQREKATINFISLFEHRDDVNNNEFKMNIDDFTAFIELANKDEYTKESTLKNNFSPEFNTKYNESEIIKTENQKKEEKEAEEQNNRDVVELSTKEKNEERFDNLLEDGEIRPKEETNIT